MTRALPLVLRGSLKGEPEVVGRGSGSYPVEEHC